MRRPALAAFALIVTTVFMTSCATVVGGTDQLISVDSNVKGAEVYYNGARVGQTPFNGVVDKARNPQLMVKKEGYEPRTMVLSTSTPTIFWGNAIFYGGFVSSTTDYASGSMFEVSPKSYYINLEPREESKTSYDYEKDTEIKRFAMLNYEEIGEDLARQRGEHLASLVKLVLKEQNESRAVKAALKKIYREAEGNVSFGEEVASYYFGQDS